jgi:hypothetical protein
MKTNTTRPYPECRRTGTVAGEQHTEPDTRTLGLEKFVGAGDSIAWSSDESGTDCPIRFFVKAATETCRQGSKPVVKPKHTGPLPPASILGIVSYCYANGVYAAEDIERKLIKNLRVRIACGNEVPRASAIRRFRALNRGAILAMLERFFCRKRSRDTATVAPAADSASLSPALDGNVQSFARKEALNRLDKAAFIDGMST